MGHPTIGCERPSMSPFRHWYRAIFVTFVAIVAVFGAFEVAERTVLRGAGPRVLQHLHLARGIGASLLAGVFVAAYFMRTAVHALPLRGDPAPAGDRQGVDSMLLERNRWLVRMRWIVVVAVAIAVVLGAFLVPVVPPSCQVPLVVTAVLIGAVNVAFTRIVRRGRNPARTLFLQMAADLMSLTVLLHFAGGLENPLMGVYVLHVILAGILLERRPAYGIAGVACFMITCIAVLEGAHLIDHYTFAFFPHRAVVSGHAEEVSPPSLETVSEPGHGEDDGDDDPSRSAAGLEHASHDAGFVLAASTTLCLLILVAASMTTSIREHLRASEQALVRNAKLAGLGRLAGGLAHEINNPVGIAVARTKLAIERAEGGGGDPTLKQDLGIIDRQLDRVTEVIRGMLAYARSTKGRRQSVDLCRVVQDVVPSSSAEGLAVASAVDVQIPAAPVRILADAGEISQIVANLLSNAYDAVTPGGGVRIGVEQDNNTVLLWVEDTGKGMTREVLALIFDPFFSTRSETGGMGLGLAIVEGLVESNRGRIDVHSSPGKGTRFEVRFRAWTGDSDG